MKWNEQMWLYDCLCVCVCLGLNLYIYTCVKVAFMLDENLYIYALMHEFCWCLLFCLSLFGWNLHTMILFLTFYFNEVTMIYTFLDIQVYIYADKVLAKCIFISLIYSNMSEKFDENFIYVKKKMNRKIFPTIHFFLSLFVSSFFYLFHILTNCFDCIFFFTKKAHNFLHSLVFMMNNYLFVES